MQSVPGVEHSHVHRIVLLRKLKPVFRLNDGPFRVLHLLAYFSFMYLWYNEPASVDAVTDLSANDTEWDGLDTQPGPAVNGASEAAVDDLDELDSVVNVPEANATALDGKADDFEIWEPKTPKDFALIAWALIALAHALFNLFCVWVVRWKVLCQHKTVQRLADADHILCVPTANHGDPAIVPIGSRLIQDPATGNNVRCSIEHVEASMRLHDAECACVPGQP